MKTRHLYYLPAAIYLALAVISVPREDNLFWLGVYSFMALVNILAALDKLSYMVVVSGFSLLLFLITSNFPPIESWGFTTKEGREIISLIIACNWMGLLGVLKLYNDSYK